MSNVTQPSSLQNIQSKFSIFNGDGEFLMVDNDEIADVKAARRITGISFYKKQQANIKLRRYIEAQGFQDNPTKLIEQFWHSPNTHEYKLTAFSPLNTALDTINYWMDSPVIPIHGNWDLVRDFLLNDICDNNLVVYEYVIHFLAHMLQFPEVKPGIMLVLLGGQGTGKGTLFKLLKHVWPKTTLMVNQVDHVTGNFNAALELHYVVCMDEALFAGDKKALDRLKSLITEPTCRIEQKYQPSRSIDSYHRFIAASNHDRFANIELDDRRFLFIRPSNKHQNNFTYFDQVHQALENPTVISAFVYHLATLDLTHFNVRNRPKTTEHTNQKVQSLTGFSRYWFEVLHSGSLTGQDDFQLSEWTNPKFVSTSTLLTNYRVFDRNSERYETTQAQSIARDLERFCPSAVATRGKIGHPLRQVRGYNLPHITVARHEFEKAIGSPLNWPDEQINIDISEVLKPYLTHAGAHP